jgi:hypothetical protein
LTGAAVTVTVQLVEIEIFVLPDNCSNFREKTVLLAVRTGKVSYYLQHTAHNKHVIPSLTVSYYLQHTAHNKHVIPSLTVSYYLQHTAHNKHVIQL